MVGYMLVKTEVEILQNRQTSKSKSKTYHILIFYHKWKFEKTDFDSKGAIFLESYERVIVKLLRKIKNRKLDILYIVKKQKKY